jgi:hypothetical protein
VVRLKWEFQKDRQKVYEQKHKRYIMNSRELSKIREWHCKYTKLILCPNGNKFELTDRGWSIYEGFKRQAFFVYKGHFTYEVIRGESVNFALTVTQRKLYIHMGHPNRGE